MKFKILIKVVIACFFTSIITSVIGQTEKIDYSTQNRYEIAGITVQGLKHMQPSAVLKLINIKEGNSILIPGPDISATLDKLWKQGLFEDVKILVEKIENDKIYLKIVLLERPRLSEIFFEGNKKKEQSELLETISLKKGVQITENIIQTTKNQINSFYYDKGYLNVQTKIELLADSNSTYLSNVLITVDRKKRVRIEDIVLNGVNEFRHGKVYRQMKETKRQKWFNIIKRSKYIPKYFEEDKLKIIEKYKKKGYRDAKIVSDTFVHVDEKHILLTININEGRKYYFRNINWVGNSLYTEEYLSRVLGIKKGDVYNEQLLDDKIYGLDGVSSLYLDNGYLFFNAEPIEKNIESDSIDLEIRIFEGNQATINRVIVNGNTKTNDHVIYREIRTKPGELFSRADIIRTQRELATLGYFNPETMGVDPKPDPANGTVDIVYNLEEQSSDQIELSGGWSGEYIVGSLKLVLTNFSAKNILKFEEWKPLPSGDGQRLSLSVTYNPRWYQSYNATFVEPWLGGKKPNSLSTSIFYSIRTNGKDKDNASFGDWATLGASVGLGRRLKKPDDFFTLYNDLSYKRYTLDNYQIYGQKSIPRYGSFNSITLGTTLTRNSIDQTIYPRSGAKFSIRGELTPPHSAFRSDAENDEIISNMETINSRINMSQEELVIEMTDVANEDAYADLTDKEKSQKYTEAKNSLREFSEENSLKWIEYFKITLESKQYTEIVNKLVLETRFQMGFLGHYNSDFKSPFERFDVGGDGLSGLSYYGVETIPLRGYESGDLTPENGGYIYNKFSMELRYPLTLGQSATIYGLLFAEAGNAWSDFSDYSPFNLKRSAGVGVRVFLPMMGILGFDYGYGFDGVGGSDKPNGWVPSFVIGQQF